jgi:NitT/TauT family transport system ATP-binding protein
LWRETGATILLITHALDEAAMLRSRRRDVGTAGRFLEIVTTHWPRERDSKIVTRPEFGNITSHLWACCASSPSSPWQSAA